MKDNKTCSRCVMDLSATNIHFDESGRCNYCKEFSSVMEKQKNSELKNPEQLDNFINKIKSKNVKRRYDCIVGVSGGVDSSWALVQAVKYGLRPLAVHMDNGWNSELAQNNIANLIRELNVDLYTYVIDWAEYKKLMQAFFDADVIDIELLYDNAMLAVNYKLAAQHGIKYILAGTNNATEGMRMPSAWNWLKYDKKNIRGLAKKFAGTSIKSYPAIGTFRYIYYKDVLKIKWISFLDYLKYNKNDAVEYLQKNFGYKPYPYKHYESIFTRFYQGYILPEKFKVDKRRLHLSTLIISGQLTRDEALEILKSIPYHSEKTLEEDKQYFMKKMGWKKEQLDDYISRYEKPHHLYSSEKPLWDWLLRIKKALRSFEIKKINFTNNESRS